MRPAAFLLILPLVGLATAARLYLRQGDLVFRPGPALRRTPADYGIDYERIHLEGSGAPSWWIPNPTSSQVVIYFHGSDGNLSHELPTVLFLRSLRVNMLLVEYPGYGEDGVRPTEASCYRAADAAWNLVTASRHFSAEHVVLFGMSLGAAVAIESSTRHDCGGLVVHSGFTSVPDMAARAYPWLPVRPFVRTRMDSLSSIRRCGCPLVVIHSVDDEHIPFDHARRLLSAAPGPKKLVALHGPHGGDRWQLNPDVRAAWTELLKKDTAAWSRAEDS